jgi:hypothetical protein
MKSPVLDLRPQPSMILRLPRNAPKAKRYAPAVTPLKYALRASSYAAEVRVTRLSSYAAEVRVTRRDHAPELRWQIAHICQLDFPDLWKFSVSHSEEIQLY